MPPMALCAVQTVIQIVVIFFLKPINRKSPAKSVFWFIFLKRLKSRNTVH